MTSRDHGGGGPKLQCTALTGTVLRVDVEDEDVLETLKMREIKNFKAAGSSSCHDLDTSLKP